MSLCPPCLPNKGQLFHFPVTDGPLLLLGEAVRCGPASFCAPVCIGPQLPRGTVVFFAPAKVAPPYRPPLPPVGPPSQESLPPPPVVVFGNSPQTCSDTCPDGYTGEYIEVTVPEDTYFSPPLADQEAANTAALLDACAQVAVLRAADPCVQEAEPGIVSVECRSADGTATLCGCPEFADVTLPNPKKYRNISWTYHVAFDQYPGTICPGGGHIPGSTDHYGLGGIGTPVEFQYDPDTCVRTGGGNVVGEDGETIPIIFTCIPMLPHACGLGTSGTKTTLQLFLDNPNFNCCNTGTVEGFLFTGASGLATLSDEDTEEDAIAREELTWTEFGSCEETAYSYIEERGSLNYVFDFIAVEARATCELLTPGRTYRVTFTFEKRAFGSGDPFDPMGTTHVIEFVAGAATEIMPDITLPKEHAIEIRIASCVIEDITP